LPAVRVLKLRGAGHRRRITAAQIDPSGRFILYSKREKDVKTATLIREIATGKETVFGSASIGPYLSVPRWSRDGKFLLGVDLRSGDSPELYDIVVCAVATESCRRLTTRAFRPIWSSNGNRIYFLRAKPGGEREVWSISSEGGDEKQIVALRPMNPITRNWDVSPEEEIVYIHFKEGRHELWLRDLPTT
jgi:Tol biopolymer transport system component